MNEAASLEDVGRQENITIVDMMALSPPMEAHVYKQ
jgi:hypothetical protein